MVNYLVLQILQIKIKKNLKDYEKYCEIRDNINIYNKNFMKIKCYSCNKFGKFYI